MAALTFAGLTIADACETEVATADVRGIAGDGPLMNLQRVQMKSHRALDNCRWSRFDVMRSNDKAQMKSREIKSDEKNKREENCTMKTARRGCSAHES